jgi:cell volume regulation protein A
VLPALLVGAVAVLFARPLAVATSVTWFRVGWREQAFLSWAGLRGAVPIVFATVPLTAGVPGATTLFDVVFVLVVLYTAAQAGTIAPTARRLGLTAPAEASDLHVETAPLDRLRADVLELDIVPGSRLAGVYVGELRLPVGAVVTLILRDGHGFVPDERTRLRRGDTLLIVATVDSRAAAERRLRAVNRSGRLARWHGDEGAGSSA